MPSQMPDTAAIVDARKRLADELELIGSDLHRARIEAAIESLVQARIAQLPEEAKWAKRQRKFRRTEWFDVYRIDDLKLASDYIDHGLDSDWLHIKVGAFTYFFILDNDCIRGIAFPEGKLVRAFKKTGRSVCSTDVSYDAEHFDDETRIQNRFAQCGIEPK